MLRSIDLLRFGVDPPANRPDFFRIARLCAHVGGSSCLDESWDFAIGGSTTPVSIRTRLQIDAAEAAVEAARAGAGIIRLFSYHVAAAVRERRLTVLFDAFEPAPPPVNLVYLGGGLLPLKVPAFLDFAAPRLKARLAEDLA